MERVKEYFNSVSNKHHFIVFSGIIGIAFAASSFSPPLFSTTDIFVLFSQEEVTLEQGVHVSSGDIGSNGEIYIGKDAVINGDLFADKVDVDKNITVNGDVSFNKLKLQKDVQILGTQTKPDSLPIAKLPEIPDFQIGAQDFKFTGQTDTLTAGSYRDITLEKDSRLTLTGGIYNLRKLELQDGAVLIFNAPATLNIQFKLRGHHRVSVLPGRNLKPDDLKINYLGIKPKKEKDEHEDDDDDIEQVMDAKEKKDHKAGNIGRPILFGTNSFLNFKLNAPKASVHIGKASTLRGQVLARKVKVGKDSVLSKEESFEKESDETGIVESGGARFLVNEIIVLFDDSATFSDAQSVVDFVGGRITGFIPSPQVYKIEVRAETIDELDELIQDLIDSDMPTLLIATRNFLLEFFTSK